MTMHLFRPAIATLAIFLTTLATQSSAFAWENPTGGYEPITVEQMAADTGESGSVPEVATVGPLLTSAFGPLQEMGIAPIAYQTGCGGCDSCGSSCSGCFGGCHSCGCAIQPAPCVDCPRVTTLNPYFNINLFGALKLDMLFSQKRNLSPGTPFFLLPDAGSGFNERTVSLHARQSTLGAAFAGPKFGGLQSGGMFIAMLYNDAVIVDQYGFLPLQGYGELKNDRWRFAAGLQFDVFSPGLPTVLPFSALAASGNAGNSFRGQIRVERFFQRSSDHLWTLQFALSDPVSSTVNPGFRILEDNGWPNVEGRIALGLGNLQGLKRPFEVGLSGVVGQLRSTLITSRQEVSDVWGVNVDLYWKITDSFGIAGEVFNGKALGTYNAGVLQNINPTTFQGIESSGGWLETFVYWTPKVHTHMGYGLDDPRDKNINFGGRTRNETYFANAIWDVNATFRVAGEVTWRETDYRGLADNESVGFHTQFQWTF